MMMAMAWMVMAFMMYLMRPQSMRNRGDTKPQGCCFFLVVSLLSLFALSFFFSRDEDPTFFSLDQDPARNEERKKMLPAKQQQLLPRHQPNKTYNLLKIHIYN